LVQRLRFGRFELLPVERQLLADGNSVVLGARALDVLLALVERRDRLVTKAELLDVVWPGLVVEEANLPVQVSALRKVIGPQAIATIPGRGYRFAMTLDDAAPTALRNRDAVVVQPPPLIGRSADLAAIEALLHAQRLVSLVGPGGVGKSLLAQWLLHRHRPAFEHGATWVDLSSVTDPGRVVGAMCAALGLNVNAGNPLNAMLGALQPLRLLVALDNAEQVVAEVARVVQAIHEQASGVRLVVTSQAPLKVPAERVYRLEPLAVPTADDDMGQALQRGALALFAERAQAADPRFALTEQNLSSAVEICRRLDGLPLAIELAAARVPLFGLTRLAGVLEERFAALGHGRRDAPERQQTLRAAMRWSHSLLDGDEQTVFRRLGVFAGSFALDAAQQVLSDERFDRWAVADALSTLIERSLVSADADDPPRYRLLETPRAFALECLAAAQEEQALRARHAQVYRGLMEQAYAEGLGPTPSMDEWRARWLPDADNAHAAGQWALQHEAETAVSLAASLAALLGSEAPTERGVLLAATRALAASVPSRQIKARWHIEAARDVAAVQTAQSLVWAEQALQDFRAVDDRIGAYRALSLLQYCDTAAPSGSRGQDLQELMALEDPHWSPALRAEGANAAACWHSTRGQFDKAIEWRRRALDLQRQAGSSWRTLVEHTNLIDSLVAVGRLDEAIACGAELEAQVRGTRRLAALPAARLNLAAAHLARDDTAAARALAQDGWPQALRLGWQPYWADYLALLAALEHRHRAAAGLLGFADAAYAAIGTAREVNEARAAERAAAASVEQLGRAAFEQRRHDGKRLADTDIAALAFATEDAG
jgi:predicted ATPase/DNA-binding winged helix-turn-helix (wHTH) protein